MTSAIACVGRERRKLTSDTEAMLTHANLTVSRSSASVGGRGVGRHENNRIR